VSDNLSFQEGHRERLRKRFLQGGLDGFLDYEIVELLLTLGTPRKDCKAVAKEAIKRFGGLKNVLDADPEELQKIKGIGPNNIFGLKLFQAINERYTKEKIDRRVPLTSPPLVVDFLRNKIGRERKENFIVLILDSRAYLITVVNISVGTLDSSLVHPREVFKEVIKHSGHQIILAHNHPSGDPTASPEDVAITRRLEEAARIFGIELLDHIIVTRDKYLSFREEELI